MILETIIHLLRAVIVIGLLLYLVNMIFKAGWELGYKECKDDYNIVDEDESE